MNAINRILPMPRHHGSPCPRLLAKAAALRDDAAETAWKLGELSAWQIERGRSLILQHQALMLRSIAATEMAHGRSVLAAEYVRAARRVEQELVAMGERG